MSESYVRLLATLGPVLLLVFGVAYSAALERYKRADREYTELVKQLKEMGYYQ